LLTTARQHREGGEEEKLEEVSTRRIHHSFYEALVVKLKLSFSF
jgi:hypothetical protein